MEDSSIAEVTRKLILNQPSLIDAIKLNVVNYTAIAELLKPKVEKTLGKKASVNAIKMALMRYSEDIKKSRSLSQDKIKRIIAESILELKNDLVLLTVKQHVLYGKIDKILNSVPSFRFLQLTQGTQTFNLIMDEKSFSQISKTIDKHYVISVEENQSAIIIISPYEIIETPGVVAYLLDLLSNENVNITQIISCHTDTVFLLNRRDSLKAYRLLEEKIISIREELNLE